MDSLLTLIMTIVRKMAGTNDKLSASDATSLLDSSKVGLLPVHNILFMKDDDLNNFTFLGVIRKLLADVFPSRLEVAA